MLSGRDSLAMINQRIRNARRNVDDSHRRLGHLNQRLSEIRTRSAEQFRQLARFRLDELAANRLIARLDDTDQTVLNLLDQKERALWELEEKIDASLARQENLTHERNAREKHRDLAVEALANRTEDLQERLEGEQAYIDRQQHCREAVARAEKAEDKARQAEEDRVEKGRPYENDALFIYLWERRYLTPDYRAWALTRTLDAWVSRLIDFDDARANYFMLTELPVRLREHATRLRQTADLEIEALVNLEREAAEADGLPGMQAELGEAEKKLHAMDDEIEAEEKRHAEYLKRRAHYSAAEDDFSRQAMDLHVAELKKKDLSDLYEMTRKTKSPRMTCWSRASVTCGGKNGSWMMKSGA